MGFQIVSFFFIALIFYFLGKRRRSKKLILHKSLEIIELSDEAMLLLSKNFTIEFTNTAFCKLFHLDFVEKISVYDLEVLKNLQLFENVKASLEKVFQTKSLCRSKVNIGEVKTFDIVMAPSEFEEGYVLVIQDKTTQKQKVSLGKEFIANATHELRTPITIIKGFVETIKDMPELSYQMLEDISEKILRSCHRMDRIVKNLLTLTDLDHLTNAHKSEFDLVSLTDNCKHDLQTIYPEAEISIVSEKECLKAFADPDLLELAIMNLMQNAVKYSEDLAKITINLEESSKEFTINISDQGKGIPKEYQESIFDRFSTVNKSESRKLCGAGLGLSIVKTIVDKHQGKISTKANSPKGTTFKMSFPKLQKFS